MTDVEAPKWQLDYAFPAPACIACRNAHHECGRERPCKRCVRAGHPEDCVPPPPKRKGRPPKIRRGVKKASLQKQTTPSTMQIPISPSSLHSQAASPSSVGEFTDAFFEPTLSLDIGEQELLNMFSIFDNTQTPLPSYAPDLQPRIDEAYISSLEGSQSACEPILPL